ncbi:ACT domain-containing protein [Amycolatopsis echigonensis]|nr:ACT domain-containing protein [Amycolatopsis niigatensis]
MSEAEARPKAVKRARISMSRELIELAALFIATGVADLFVSTLSQNRVGPVVLFTLGGLLIATVLWRRWWTHRPRPDPAHPAANDCPPRTGVAWRVRATVRDVPGSLAGVTTVLAAHGCDIVSLQVLAVPDGVVDEFLVRAPGGATAADIATVVERGGGREVRVVPADAHEFVDLPTRVLRIAAAREPDLDQLLRAVMGDCGIERKPPGRRGTVRGEGIDGTVMRLAEAEGGTVTVTRSLPFTPAEFARAKAVLDLHRRLSVPTAAVPAHGGDSPAIGAPLG